MFKRLSAVVVLGLCSCVYSVRPLSDESNSVFDERLAGAWRQVGEEAPSGLVVFGRQRDTRNTMEFVSVSLEDEQVVKVERGTMFARAGREHRYLSFAVPNEQQETRYWIMRYELPEPGRLRISSLNREFLEAAVRRGDLKGEIKPAPGGNSRNRATVLLDDSPDVLLRFLDEHPEQAFDGSTEFRRID
jgi:hypothetical protein